MRCTVRGFACATVALIAVAPGLFDSCSAFATVEEIAAPDLRPPQLMNIRAVSPNSFELLFDEPAQIAADQSLLEPTRGVLTCSNGTTIVTVTCERSMEPGACYLFEATAADAGGNCLSFMAHVYGLNANPAEVRINEFITNGTTTHPDLVELAVTSDGSLAGVCLALGTPDDWDARIVLPDVGVTAGEFVLVHCKSSGDAAEVDEISDRAASGGLDASPDAWDYWMPEGTGLSANNGVMTLAVSPDGETIDAVIYSNRTSESDDRYRGFGSTRMLDWVDSVVADGAWRIDGELARPEDAVNPADSTSTRSICRASNSADTDSRSDWHIVPTRGATFGGVNIDDVYVP